MATLTNELFSLRDNEMCQIYCEPPEIGRWIAVQIVPVTMPDGPRYPVRPADGKPVEQAAIVSCEKVDGQWQWCQLSPVTKEIIGDLLFDSSVEPSRWYYVSIIDNSAHPTGKES